jgi:L-lactate dehydrogenase complex protein LldE
MAVSLLSARVACWNARKLPGRLEQSQAYQGEMTMQAALMVPCYIDMFYPHVGIAALELLERLGVDVVYPKDQTCRGQPMANSGCYEEARAAEEHCSKVFGSFDCVVTPSGTHHIRNKFTAAADSPEKQNLVRNTYDLVEFLHDVLKIREFPWAKFRHKVALHSPPLARSGRR